MSEQAIVRVPASSANLGPAFDCLALALDLWNETKFEIADSPLEINISGEGEDSLPVDEINLIYRAFQRVYTETGKPLPGLKITCRQEVPLGSGLGSSAAAVLAGLLGANALGDGELSDNDILRLGVEFEGHADNLAASMHGGLVLVTREPAGYRAQKLESAELNAVIILPEVRLSTQEARNALPKQVSREDAVFNVSHSLQVLDALRISDIDALSLAMQDRLHQPYRLPLIPGAAEALQAAQDAGAAAALSGAGPGLMAFVETGREKAITEAMRAPFAERGIKTRQYLLRSTNTGARVGVS
ncbi:MAG: homoserine kinase [Anaerolineales bacterium]